MVEIRYQFSTRALVGYVTLLGILLTGCKNGAPVAGITTDEAPFVAIAQTIKHPRLDAVSKGIEDALAEAGYREGENLRWEWRSANGNPATAAQIARKYAQAKPDVIVAIASLTAQATVAATTTPVIFSAVNDPVGADLIQTVERPGGLVSGVSSLSPVAQHMALIREVLPTAKTMGVIYSAEDARAASLAARVQAEAPQQNFVEVKPVSVSAEEEIESAAQSLVGMVDVIYVPREHSNMPILESVIPIGQESDLPVFGEDGKSVERGAIAGLGVDDYEVGRQAGEMVVKVLRGNRVGELPVEPVSVVELFVNPTAAEAMGVVLPSAVIERAERVFE